MYRYRDTQLKKVRLHEQSTRKQCCFFYFECTAAQTAKYFSVISCDSDAAVHSACMNGRMDLLEWFRAIFSFYIKNTKSQLRAVKWSCLEALFTGGERNKGKKMKTSLSIEQSRLNYSNKAGLALDPATKIWKHNVPFYFLFFQSDKTRLFGDVVILSISDISV